jgi:hypothetical protein
MLHYRTVSISNLSEVWLGDGTEMLMLGSRDGKLSYHMRTLQDREKAEEELVVDFGWLFRRWIGSPQSELGIGDLHVDRHG